MRHCCYGACQLAAAPRYLCWIVQKCAASALWDSVQGMILVLFLISSRHVRPRLLPTAWEGPLRLCPGLNDVVHCASSGSVLQTPCLLSLLVLLAVLGREASVIVGIPQHCICL